jgi:hypothetical protein
MASPTPALLVANKGKSFTWYLYRENIDWERGEIGAAIIAVLADVEKGDEFKLKRQHKRTVFLTYICSMQCIRDLFSDRRAWEREEKNVTEHKKYCSLGHYGGCFPHTHTRTNKQYVTVWSCLENLGVYMYCTVYVYIRTHSKHKEVHKNKFCCSI